MRIHQLTSTLANQIAAGEVVERPASVAKELIENSLDSGAGKIEVEVENGGIGAIRVRDDGHGIHVDDLALALARHATSKLRSAAELEAIRSLGFRGEALPSIASVARVEIRSRYQDSDAGWQLKAEGGTQSARPVPSPHPAGTSVTVRDLFFNTPARRKFLRTRNTEFRHLETAFKCIALSRFDVELVLRHDERAVYTLARALDARQRDRRVARVCGSAFVDQALCVEFESGDLKMWGWLGSPTYHRGQGDLQYFFVNGRPVRDGVARHAIRQAYGQALPPGRQPGYIVFLEIDPGAVDVNVHPTKQEVRFREARLVHDFLSRAAARALQHPEALAIPGPLGPTVTGAVPAPEAPVWPSMVRDPSWRTGPDPRPSEGWAPVSGAERTSRPSGLSAPRVCGGLLLTTRGENLALIDVATARRWVLSRRMHDGLRSGRIRSRPLLLPESMAVGESAADRLEICQPGLEILGFGLHRAGPATVVLRELPVPLAGTDPRAVVRELAVVVSDRAPAPTPGAAAGMTDSDAVRLARGILDAFLDRIDALVDADVGAPALETLLGELERGKSEAGSNDGLRAWVEVSPARLRRLFDELLHEG